MAQLRVPVSEKDHIQGSFHAPITLVEYGDYQCPYCAKAHSIIKQLQRSLDSNLRFIFRNFPLKQMHQYAEEAAETAEAAALQSKFWEMHDRILENQRVLSTQTLNKFILQLELDSKKIENDKLSIRVKNKIEEDFRSGIRSGVNGTPCFFINGERYDGDLSFDALMHAIEAVTT